MSTDEPNIDDMEIPEIELIIRVSVCVSLCEKEVRVGNKQPVDPDSRLFRRLVINSLPADIYILFFVCSVVPDASISLNQVDSLVSFSLLLYL